MKKLCMIMADPDVSYMESVSAYIRDSRYWDEFDLKLFSTSERLLDFLETRSPYDILLISERFLPSLFNGQQEHAIVLLEENEPLQFSPDQQALFKYQPLDQLLSSVVSIYRSNFGEQANPKYEKSKTNVISVFSGSGGSGKTTFAINLCRQMAKEHRKVFYLNLELSHSTPLFLSSSEPQQSSQILYYVKTHPEQTQSKIESLKKFDPQAKVDYFDFMVSPQEMTDLTGQETEILISAIADTNDYDALIIDLESSLHERIKAVLEKSKQIFWMINHDLASFHKNAAIVRAIDEQGANGFAITKKASFIVNRYIGSLSQEMSRYELPVKHFLPYVPEWKSLSDGAQIHSSPVYSKAVNSLIEAMSTDSRNRSEGFD